jgi:tyrosine-protein phosphatase SIW14
MGSNANLADSTELIPPVNFSLVARGIYRGSYPNFRNFTFMQQLNLHSVLFLCPEEYSPTNKKFLDSNNIRLLNVAMEGNKEPFHMIQPDLVHQALNHITDTRNHPIYIHCNKGKHRTGTVVGCLRKLQLWTLTSVFEEYRRFAGIKARAIDQQYIELYIPLRKVIDHGFLPPWLGHLQ